MTVLTGLPPGRRSPDVAGAGPLVATRSPPEPKKLGRTASLVARERRLRTHRVCDPQDAAYVFRMCLVDRSILPRQHQRDRGVRPDGHGVHRRPAPGSYNEVLAWPGRQGWLTDFSVAVSMRCEVLKRHEVSAREIKDCAQVLSGYVQDQRTGRRCVVRPSTVASVLVSYRKDCLVHERTVQRCQAAMRELGFLVDIGESGRRLNLEEKAQAQRGHSQQSGFATEAALTIPAPVVDSLTLATPSKGGVRKSESDLKSPPLNSANPKQKEATPSPLRRRGPPRASPALDLAVKVVKKFPWLCSESPRRLVPALKPFVESRPAWDEHDLHNGIQTLRLTRGMVTALTVDQIRTRPAVVFAAFLRELHPHDDHPRLPFVTPAELRCGRDECDHGWIPDDSADNRMRELIALPLEPRKCDQCRPGAWPEPTYEELCGELDEEAPF